MINLNGKLIEESDFALNHQNRAFKYGDAIFDTLKYEGGSVHYIEDHYFRLMSSLRMLRMSIPMKFTLNFYENEILKTLKTYASDKAIRIRVTVFRKEGGMYKPLSNEINFVIEVSELTISTINNYEIELYKDFHVFSGILSTIKTNNKLINVLANIYASENNYQNCILINERKHIVEATNANIFLIRGNEILTPPLSEGCINGIIRKKIIDRLKGSDHFVLKEIPISPFDLLKVEEVFITNSIIEIQSVHQFRKKIYRTKKTQEIERLFEQN